MTPKDEDEVAGVRLTHSDKVLYPDQGLTKRELAGYLNDVAKRMLPFVARHPLSLVRCPAGVTGKCFYQKHLSAKMPAGFKTVSIREKDGDKADYLYVEDASGIVAAAQIGALELHVWGAANDDLEHPDRIVFDLDPAEEVGFDSVKDAARTLRDVLIAAGLMSFPMVTGGKGIHVIAPLDRSNDWDEVKTFAASLARSLTIQAPERFIATASKAKRKGRIFIDWLRNERGATAVAPYSPRARNGAPVAVPVDWNELMRLKSANSFDTESVLARLAEAKADPWEGFNRRQHISAKALAAAEKAAEG